MKSRKKNGIFDKYSIIIISILVVTPVILHINFYETWGNNEHYYLPVNGMEVTCDMNLFQNPSNCHLINGQEEIVKWPENQKTKSEDERKFFCESHEGQWSDEFNNCVGGSMEVSCDYVSTSEFKPPNVFSKIMNQDGTCISHEFFCKSMGGNSACMSYEQIGHGREICSAICKFEVMNTK